MLSLGAYRSLQLSASKLDFKKLVLLFDNAVLLTNFQAQNFIFLLQLLNSDVQIELCVAWNLIN